MRITMNPGKRSLFFACLWGTVFLLSLAGIKAPVQAQSSSGLGIGASMPMAAEPMQTATGGTVTLQEVQKERGTLVMFWCNTCPWVERYEDRVVEMAQEYQSKGIGFVAINPNDASAYPEEGVEAMKQRAKQGSYPFPYAADKGSAIAQAFGANRTPQVFLFDGDQRLVYAGTVDDSPRSAASVENTYLENAMDAVLAGESIAEARTKAFGCTIKWQ